MPFVTCAVGLTFACSGEVSKLADEHQAVGAEPSPSTPNQPSSPSEPAVPAESDEPPPGAATTTAVLEPAGDTGELPDPAPPGMLDDSPAPIVPSGPAPGSAEADAELAELLDESTLTQEEFDNAFRGGGGPKIEGDQFVFGADERSRNRPLVDVLTPSVTGASVSPSKLADLARASQRDLEGCYAMALGKDPSVAGAVTLRLRFDANGDVSSAQIDASSSLGDALDRCLVSVSKGWRLAAAASATVRVPLKLSAIRANQL